jgi:hypothetical protein
MKLIYFVFSTSKAFIHGTESVKKLIKCSACHMSCKNMLRGTEDTRVHILHIMHSSMQNGVKLPRVLVIET